MTLPPTVFSQDTYLCLDGRIVRNSAFPTDAGGYADVYVGIFESRKVAIKVVRPFRLNRDKLLRRLWREYLAWSRLSHPNILPCLGYSYDFSPERYALPSLISPWMANGAITSYLEDHSEADRLNLLVGVAKGLCYLHTRDPVIIHGDLRGGNILVTDQGVPCLTDFGLSRVLEEIKGLTTSSDLAGTVRWMSPELFENDGEISIPSDVWAFGMTVLEVISGERPYSTVRNDLLALGQIREGRLPSRPQDPVVLEMLDDDVWDLCQRCWSFEPAKRPAVDAIIQLIQQSRQYVEEVTTHTIDAIMETTVVDSQEAGGQRLVIKTLFEDMVGCEEIVKKLEGYQQVARNVKALGKDAREHIPTNFLFKGPSGTGKTMVARKMGQVYYNLGILRSTEVVECSATDLAGPYFGQAGLKTKKIFAKALGRVLLIDQIYWLSQGQFAKETVKELDDILMQETFRAKLVVILAGNEQDMDKLMAVYTGITRWFPDEIIFHHIPPVQCLEVLDRKLRKENVCVDAFQDSSCEEYARMVALIQELSLLPSSWGNGRDLDILVDQMETESIDYLTLSTPSHPEGFLTLPGTKAVECIESMLSLRRIITQQPPTY